MYLEIYIFLIQAVGINSPVLKKCQPRINRTVLASVWESTADGIRKTGEGVTPAPSL